MHRARHQVRTCYGIFPHQPSPLRRVAPAGGLSFHSSPRHLSRTPVDIAGQAPQTWSRMARHAALTTTTSLHALVTSCFAQGPDHATRPPSASFSQAVCTGDPASTTSTGAGAADARYRLLPSPAVFPLRSHPLRYRQSWTNRSAATAAASRARRPPPECSPPTLPPSRRGLPRAHGAVFSAAGERGAADDAARSCAPTGSREASPSPDFYGSFVSHT